MLSSESETGMTSTMKNKIRDANMKFVQLLLDEFTSTYYATDHAFPRTVKVCVDFLQVVRCVFALCELDLSASLMYVKLGAELMW